MPAFGIDIGAAAVKTAVVDDENQVVWSDYTLHHGDIRGVITTRLKQLRQENSFGFLRLGAVTGSGQDLVAGRIEAVNEVAAVVAASKRFSIQAASIVEIGAQTAKYITGLKTKGGHGIKVSMNANCASGTGGFLEEQISRLNLSMADFSDYAARAKSIPRIAGRCGVFAKTDITHHQQEGVPVADILLGLAYAVVRNFRASVMKKLPLELPILFTGGVAHNKAIIRALNDVLELGENDLIIPDHFNVAAAAGAAMIALEQGLETRLLSPEALDFLCGREPISNKASAGLSLPPLASFGQDDSLGKHDIQTGLDTESGFFLGIDVGSTSTNLVLIDPKGQVADFRYLRTRGEPAAVVSQGLEELKSAHGHDMKILGTGVTGSGRYLIGKMVGAGTIKDEITAQAKAAVTIDPDVDTVFEIGGQDSKFIRIKDGQVADFQMNKVCAAGTGSFIEEQAVKFDIPIDYFGITALSSNAPVDLGERCAVFMETTLAGHLARGAQKNDLAAGLCYSIVKNYLNRVVGGKQTGNHILFQGGLGHNQGVVNAFRAVLGKKIEVPAFFSVTGALGAALLAKDAAENNTGAVRPKLKGCLPGQDADTGKENRFSDKVQALVFDGYTGILDPDKKTVGLPRALFSFGMFSMFYTFFKTLGFNVLMSPSSDAQTIALAQACSLDETCYPVKLVNGHIAWLISQKVDYIFFPDLYTVHHPGAESRQNFGCAYMQLAFKLMNQAMDLEKTGITLLSPTIAFSLGPQFMKDSFTRLGQTLGRTQEETMAALGASMTAFQQFEKRLEAHGKKVLNDLGPDEKAFVLISKIYGVADPVLNLGIPDRLAEMGYKTLCFFDLPEGNIFKEHPNMYWPFIQHILDPAYLIKEHPNLFAILLTHHGCGPDSVSSHFFAEIMADKPFLSIEVDEHASPVGVMTRLEAFVDRISHIPAQRSEPIEIYENRIVHTPVNITPSINRLPPGTRVFLPQLPAYSSILKEILARQGIPANVLPLTEESALNRGRQHTTANEYFSLTALLGDILEHLDQDPSPETAAFIIPQTEGAEVDGQYSRFIRTKLDQEGFTDTKLVSPFMEDGIAADPDMLQDIFMGILAADLVWLAPTRHRQAHLSYVTGLIQQNELTLDNLVILAVIIRKNLAGMTFKKQIFITGDPLVMFNDFLTDSHFSRLESQGYRVVFAPMSEYLALLWKDFAQQNGKENTAMLLERVDKLWGLIRGIDRHLDGTGVFSKNLDDIAMHAQNTLGYYAGANGRYRLGKCLDVREKVDGIITVSPMYENTGICLNAMARKFDFPLLNLTLDGNRNPSDNTRLDAFLYYL